MVESEKGFNPLELIEGILNQAGGLAYRDSGALDALTRRFEMVIRNIFGRGSKYLKDLNDISFYPCFAPSSEDYQRQCWRDGQNAVINLGKTMQEELKLFGSGPDKTKPKSGIGKGSAKSGKIFIVHGHDEAMRESVARAVTKLNLEPIILHEKPSKGRTIIEKFSEYGDVGFSVVLLSPDDVGCSKGGSPEGLRPRARQNVIFELGYFLGRLGREHVLALYRQEPEFELPSDYSGVLFVPYDSGGRWQFDLVKELKSAGYEVDANKLLSVE